MIRVRVSIYRAFTNGHTGGVVKIRVIPTKNGGEPIIVDTRICDCQTIITGYYYSVDTGRDFVEVSFAAPGHGFNPQWRPEYVPIEAVRVRDVFKKELIPKGLAVTEANIHE